MQRFFLKSTMKTFPICLLNCNQDVLRWWVLECPQLHFWPTSSKLLTRKNARKMWQFVLLPEKVIVFNQNISRANCRNQVLWKILAMVLCVSAKSEKMIWSHQNISWIAIHCIANTQYNSELEKFLLPMSKGNRIWLCVFFNADA